MTAEERQRIDAVVRSGGGLSNYEARLLIEALRNHEQLDRAAIRLGGASPETSEERERGHLAALRAVFADADHPAPGWDDVTT